MTKPSPECPSCKSQYAYIDNDLWTCPECFHEWNQQDAIDEETSTSFLDIHGVALQHGDSVIIAKDLKIGSATIKSGTKVKHIRLLETPVDGHDISCKIEGYGSMYLKCSVVKKA